MASRLRVAGRLLSQPRYAGASRAVAETCDRFRHRLTRHAWLAFAATLVVVPAVSLAQERGGLDPAALLEPLEESWPTYSGDYSGRRYSRLTEVTADNVTRLTLAWTRQLDTGMPALQGSNAPTFIGGEGTGEFSIGSQRIKGSILQVGDLLYVVPHTNVCTI